MKHRIYLFTLVMVFGAFSLSAQNFGLRAGANIANLTGDVQGNTTVVAWQLGPFVNVDVSENLKLNIAALYSKKGSKDELTNITGGLKYLEVPVMFRLNVSALFIQAGGYGSYLLSANSGDTDISDFFKNGDYGISFGAGISFGNLTFDGRYSYGLANINDVSIESIKNSVITFGVEIGF